MPVLLRKMVFSVQEMPDVWKETCYSLQNVSKIFYKTSNGKYIAPQAIEMEMSSDKYIEQIAVIGDQRKFVSALVVPVLSIFRGVCRSNKRNCFQ